MGKYEPLVEFLNKTSKSEVRLTFRNIEEILNRKLPRSAVQHRAWWSNNPMNSVMTKAWLDAGWKSEQVDMAEGKVTFRRVRNEELRGSEVRPSVFGCLKGTTRVSSGADLTAPTGARWNAQEGKLHE